MPAAETQKMLNGASTLVTCCANLQPGESVLIISEDATRQIGEMLSELCLDGGNAVNHITVPAMTIHGQEPPDEAAAAMSESDVIFGLTRMSMAHSQARRAATDRGAKYLSLPEYTPEILVRTAMCIDFREITPACRKVFDLLNKSKSMTIITEGNNKLFCDIGGRDANLAPGWCFEPGSMASPPDAEVNIAPVETETRGIYAVNGSITSPAIGLLTDTQRLVLENGAVKSISGSRAKDIEELFGHAENDCARIAGEIGFGLNPLAELTGAMLEDEGCLGCLHIGFGSNATIGGRNKVAFHVDFVTRRPTVILDDNIVLLKDGLYVGEIGQQLAEAAKKAKE